MLSVVRGPTTSTRRSTLINANPYGNGTAIFTSSGEAARRFQRGVQRRHDRHQRARSRCRWPTTPSAAGRTPCSATSTSTAPRASPSTPARKVVTSRWPHVEHDRAPAGSTLSSFPTGAADRSDRFRSADPADPVRPSTGTKLGSRHGPLRNTHSGASGWPRPTTDERARSDWQRSRPSRGGRAASRQQRAAAPAARRRREHGAGGRHGEHAEDHDRHGHPRRTGRHVLGHHPARAPRPPRPRTTSTSSTRPTRTPASRPP